MSEHVTEITFFLFNLKTTTKEKKKKTSKKKDLGIALLKKTVIKTIKVAIESSVLVYELPCDAL